MKKLDLGGIAAGPAASRSTHPVIEVTDEETMKLLVQFTVINPQYKTLKNQSETLSKQLAGRIKALFFNRFKGITPDSSTMLVVAGGRSIKLTTKDAYSKSLFDDAPLIKAIGAELVAKWFKQATVLKLELEKCPDDKQEQFASQVIALAKELGVTDAVSATQCIQPKAGFHEARTRVLTVEQNLAVDALLPITAYPQL